MEVSKRGACKGRGESSEWRVKKYQPREWVKTAGRGSGSAICSGSKACRRARRKKEEMRQLQRMQVMTDMTKKIKSKGRKEVKNSWWVSELLAADCQTAWLHPGWEDTLLQWCNCMFEMKKDEGKRMAVEHQKVGQSYDQKC